MGGLRASNRFQIVDGVGNAPPRRPVTVLYVEDDIDDVYLLGRQLDHLPSFEVEYAHAPSLAVARSMLARHTFDVVLADFWLGSETTIPLIDEVKSLPVPSPVILVSSLENDDIELIGRRAGAAGFVAKSDLTAASLERIFSTLLADGTARTAAETPEAGHVARCLRSLLRSLDRVQDGDFEVDGTLAEARALVGDALLPAADCAPARATLSDPVGRPVATAVRFDAVPYLVDAVGVLSARTAPSRPGVRFTAPLVPILIEASPSLFGDLLQGFFAEAGDLVAQGGGVVVSPSVRGGALLVDLAGTGPAPPPLSEPAGEEARLQAAARMRRLLTETLARACGGAAEFGAGALFAGRLRVPLRASA